jgi:hypothetical protein
MAHQVPNHLKYLLATKAIDFANDEFKAILMDADFVFNKDTHALYADISADELPTNFGYTQKTEVLAGVAVDEDDTNDRSNVTWTNPSWTAAAGSIGPSIGMCIIDETAADDPVIAYIDFGAEYTQVDGGAFVISGVGLRIT